jgi:hypothetical protein
MLKPNTNTEQNKTRRGHGKEEKREEKDVSAAKRPLYELLRLTVRNMEIGGLCKLSRSLHHTQPHVL